MSCHWRSVSLSHGGGSSEVGEEFEAEAHHKVPDVSGHLGSGDEDSPDDHRQDCVEGVTNVPQPRMQTQDTLVNLGVFNFRFSKDRNCETFSQLMYANVCAYTHSMHFRLFLQNTSLTPITYRLFASWIT